MTTADFLTGEYLAIPPRKLSDATVRKWGYRCAKDRHGKWCQVADYYTPDGTELVAQKVRYPDKSFTVVGDMKRAGLYGQHLWRDGGRMVVITEGEIDAMSVSQAQDLRYPVVSVPNGAQGAKKAIAKALEWLTKFDTVVFCLDNDEPGQKAAVECAAVLPPGKAKIARLPLKDANDMLKAGQAGALIDALWGAKPYRPDGLIGIEDVEEEVLRPIQTGLPWFLPSLTSLTYGRRMGECVGLGAGTGIGKTELLTQQIAYDLTQLKQPVAVFALEQEPAETVLRLAGKVAGVPLHIPDEDRPVSVVRDALTLLKAGGRLHLYNHYGVVDWHTIKDRIRFLHHSEGVRLFYLDHLTAFAASDPSREREILEEVMAGMGQLVKEMPIWIFFVSHLTTPEGKSHEEGGRVTIRGFKGARAIGFWSHFMLGLERDQQAEDEGERGVTTLRCLKDRYTGRSTGKTIELRYDEQKGLLRETGEAALHSNEFTPGEEIPF